MSGIVCDIVKSVALMVCLVHLRVEYNIRFLAYFMVLLSVLSWGIIGYLEGINDRNKRN